MDRATNLETAEGQRQAAPSRRALLFALRLAVGVGVLAFILSRVDHGAATIPATAQVAGAVGLAAVLLLASQGVAALRWRLILADDGLPWRYLYRLYVIGSFFGLFLPTSVGGDVVRAAAAAGSSRSRARTVASVLLDRALGLAATVAFAAVGLVVVPGALRLVRGDDMHWHTPSGTLVVAALGVLAAGAIAVTRSRRVRRLWQDGFAAAGELARSPRRLARVSGLALVSQGLIVTLWAVLARGMSLAIPLSFLLWAVPVVTLAALLPVTFSGLGVREGAWLLLLGGSGIPEASIVTFSLLYFACNVLVAIVGGLLALAALPVHLAVNGVPGALEVFIYAWLTTPLEDHH